jgi:hypothetical protein
MLLGWRRKQLNDRALPGKYQTLGLIPNTVKEKTRERINNRHGPPLLQQVKDYADNFQFPQT